MYAENGIFNFQYQLSPFCLIKFVVKNAPLLMKKSTHYVPYLFAALIPGYIAVTNNLLFKPGLAPV